MCYKGPQLRPLVFLIFSVQCLLLTKDALAHEGWGIVVNRQGHIFFSDIPNNTIWRIKPNGKPEKFLTNRHSHALVLASDGSIYGTQEHHARGLGSVWKIAPNGNVTDVFTPQPTFPLNLHPFTIDKAGNIYSTNSISFAGQRDKVLLMKATIDGQVSLIAGGKKGFKDGWGNEAQFNGIDGMVWTSDTTLLVTDGAYLRKVSLSGVVSTVGVKPLTEPRYGEDLMGLDAAIDGSVYIADYSQGRILKQTVNGNIQIVSKTGFFWAPTGVAVVQQELYVMDCLKMPFVLLGDLGVGPYIRIRKISATGDEEIIETVWGRNTLPFAVATLLLLAGIVFIIKKRRRKRIVRSKEKR